MTSHDNISISVVIPVYQGDQTLPELMAEIEPLTHPNTSPEGHDYQVTEVLLVWDRGPGNSDQIIRELADKYSFVKPVWLSRNFGQHAATIAGMSSSGGEWIVTMDEDGQQDPRFIPQLLDCAYRARAQLVYGTPSNPPPHSRVRNAASKVTKKLFAQSLANGGFAEFNSYRLLLGEIGRSVAAYTGAGVYLDVALSWVVADSTEYPVVARREGRVAANYSYRKLASHFGRMIVSSGTKPLFFVSALGFTFFGVGLLAILWIIIQRVRGEFIVAGWASTFTALMLIGGSVLLGLGIIAQYVGAATNMSLGKPLYVVVRDPQRIYPPSDPSKDL
jgi:glycosyltransferase involved in cell wall biosynthesis